MIWLREVLGWFLLVLGLLIFGNCFSYLNQRQVIEGSVICFMGFFIFRGGLQMLKVAFAVKAMRDEQDQIPGELR